MEIAELKTCELKLLRQTSQSMSSEVRELCTEMVEGKEHMLQSATFKKAFPVLLQSMQQPVPDEGGDEGGDPKYVMKVLRSRNNDVILIQ